MVKGSILWGKLLNESKNSKVFEQKGDLLSFKFDIDPEPSWAKLSQVCTIFQTFAQQICFTLTSNSLNRIKSAIFENSKSP